MASKTSPREHAAEGIQDPEPECALIHPPLLVDSGVVIVIANASIMLNPVLPYISIGFETEGSSGSTIVRLFDTDIGLRRRSVGPLHRGNPHGR
jgi:hypothetical protein